MKTLFVYFSWSNNTKNLVERLNQEFNYDVIRIERKIPYSKNYNTCAYVEAKKEWDERILPEIKDIDSDISSYDKILLFFPIWWYTIPMPIGTFVSEYLTDFKGEVIAFANSYTNDSQYMFNSMKDLKNLNKNLNLNEGLFNCSIKDHISFIKEKK